MIHQRRWTCWKTKKYHAAIANPALIAKITTTVSAMKIHG
jgi:hypothetical protein